MWPASRASSIRRPLGLPRVLGVSRLTVDPVSHNQAFLKQVPGRQGGLHRRPPAKPSWPSWLRRWLPLGPSWRVLDALRPTPAPKMAPRRPKTRPRWPQDVSKTAQADPKTAQDAHKTAQDAPKTVQDGPEPAQEPSKTVQDAPKTSQEASGAPPEPPRRPPGGLKSLIFPWFLYIFHISI